MSRIEKKNEELRAGASRKSMNESRERHTSYTRRKISIDEDATRQVSPAGRNKDVIHAPRAYTYRWVLRSFGTAITLLFDLGNIDAVLPRQSVHDGQSQTTSLGTLCWMLELHARVVRPRPSQLLLLLRWRHLDWYSVGAWQNRMLGSMDLRRHSDLSGQPHRRSDLQWFQQVGVHCIPRERRLMRCKDIPRNTRLESPQIPSIAPSRLTPTQ